MLIKIPDTLPARKVLEAENIFVMSRERAAKQDIRPLRILILNIMPTKIATETQLLRLLGNTPTNKVHQFVRTWQEYFSVDVAQYEQRNPQIDTRR